MWSRLLHEHLDKSNFRELGVLAFEIMNEIVFTGKKDVPYATSKIISDLAGIEHQKIKSTIRKYKKQIDFFGLSAPYQAESTGGHPEGIYLKRKENGETITRFAYLSGAPEFSA